jgi:hypothetical protein
MVGESELPIESGSSAGYRSRDDLPAVVLLHPDAHEFQRAGELRAFVVSVAGLKRQETKRSDRTSLDL